jgi:hypothetical protein
MYRSDAHHWWVFLGGWACLWYTQRHKSNQYLKSFFPFLNFLPEGKKDFRVYFLPACLSFYLPSIMSTFLSSLPLFSSFNHLSPSTTSVFPTLLPTYLPLFILIFFEGKWFDGILLFPLFWGAFFFLRAKLKYPYLLNVLYRKIITDWTFCTDGSLLTKYLYCNIPTD